MTSEVVRHGILLFARKRVHLKIYKKDFSLSDVMSVTYMNENDFFIVVAGVYKRGITLSDLHQVWAVFVTKICTNMLT